MIVTEKTIMKLTSKTVIKEDLRELFIKIRIKANLIMIKSVKHKDQHQEVN